jgi:hypothetical protein
MKHKIRLLLSIVLLWLFCNEAKPQQMTVKKASHFRKSPPLTEMAAVLAGPRDRSWKDSLVRNLSYEERKKVDHQLTPPAADPVRQVIPPSLPNNGPVLNFDGVGNVNSVYPPDTDGDVGLNHYFQMINLSFAIYDKQGNNLFGPVNNSTLWAGFIGPWTGTNDGDPVVLYDELADRWMASQFAVNTPMVLIGNLLPFLRPTIHWAHGTNMLSNFQHSTTIPNWQSGPMPITPHSICLGVI